MTDNKLFKPSDAIYFYLSILAGLLIAQQIKIAVAVWMITGCLSLILFFLFRRKSAQYILEQPSKKAARIALLLVLFCMAASRTTFQYSDLKNPFTGFAEINLDEKISVTGIVIRPPEVKTNRTYLRVQADSIHQESEIPIKGTILAILYQADDEISYGDRVRLSGKITLIGTDNLSSYQRYLDSQNVDALMYSPTIERIAKNQGSRFLAGIYKIRKQLLARVYQLYPAPESALMAGIILGDESKISPDIEEAFQRTGTAHIIAISGANFAVLTWLLLKLSKALFHRWWSPLVTIPLIFLYALITGGKSAILRAAIMCSITIIGMTIGRSKSGVHSLLFSVCLIGIANPKSLLEISLQLSVMATLGILLFKDPVLTRFSYLLKKIRKLPEEARTFLINFLDEMLLISLTAQIFTVWISASAFQQCSMVSLFANFLITPFQSMIMLGGILSVAVSYFFEPLGTLVAGLVWVAPAYTIRVVQLCAGLPDASRFVKLTEKSAWLIIAVILFLWIFRKNIFRWEKEKLIEKGLFLLFLLSVMIWKKALDQNDHRLKIVYSENSESQQIQIQTPFHQKILIASNISNYAAQNLLERRIFDVDTVRAVVFDFSEVWMKDNFLKNIHDMPEIIYLDGVSANQKMDLFHFNLPKISQGFEMKTEDMTLSNPIAYLHHHGWMIGYKKMQLFIPMGITVRQIQKQNREDIIEQTTIILLGKNDNYDDWKNFIQSFTCKEGICNAFPVIVEAVKNQDMEIYSNGNDLWLYDGIAY